MATHERRRALADAALTIRGELFTREDTTPCYVGVVADRPGAHAIKRLYVSTRTRERVWYVQPRAHHIVGSQLWLISSHLQCAMRSMKYTPGCLHGHAPRPLSNCHALTASSSIMVVFMSQYHDGALLYSSPLI